MRGSIVKISHSSRIPELKLATEEGYERISLNKGRELELEVTDERRCVGFHASRGEMTPCSEFRKLESGDQCGECRGKDIYTDYRRGGGDPGVEGTYSVYLVQIGSKLKVGVTRSSRIQNRWKEQGAELAAEIENDLTAEEALELESEISSEEGISERIRKEDKNGSSEGRLSEKIQELGYDTEVHQISSPLECVRTTRKGRFPAPIKRVKGQIVSNGRICMIMTSGKVVQRAEQKELQSFE